MVEEQPKQDVIRSSRTGFRVGLAGLVVAIAGLAVAVVALLHTVSPVQPHVSTADDALQESVTVAFPPPSGGQFLFGNNVGGIALSPDGRWVAYVASTDRPRLWVRMVDYVDGGSSDHFLLRTEGAAYPFWSPDSKSIAFFAEGQLKRVELAGGEPRKICSVAIGRGGSWTDSNEIIFGSLLSGLSRVPASGGDDPVPLTRLDPARGETGHSWPQMLPGGRFIYWIRSNSKDIQGVYGASLENPGARTLVKGGLETNAVYATGAHGNGYLLWLVRGALKAQRFDPLSLTPFGDETPLQIGHSVSKTGLFGHANLAIPAKGLLLYAPFNTASQFAWFSRDGAHQTRFGESGQYTTFRISPTGSRIAVSQDKADGTDLLIDVQARSNAIVTDPGMNSYPIWSPDGHAILYTSSRLNLVLKYLEGASGSRPLTDSPNPQYATDWSRDGRSVLYWEVSPGKKRRQLWFLPTDVSGNHPANANAQPYVTTDYNDAWGRFSPETEPQWVAYQSDASGNNEIYVEEFPKTSGNPIKISTHGGQYPAWNPDGGAIYYVSPDYKLMEVLLKRTRSQLQASEPRELFQLPAADIGWPPYDVDPATGRILVRATVSDQSPQPLDLIVNWTLLAGSGLGG